MSDPTTHCGQCKAIIGRDELRPPFLRKTKAEKAQPQAMFHLTPEIWLCGKCDLESREPAQ